MAILLTLAVSHLYRVIKNYKPCLVAACPRTLGDHTYVVKDGRKMPGVVSLHQSSETQGKPSYFRGHNWGGLALLIGSHGRYFGCPLNLKIHQGFRHITNEEGEKEEDKQTLGIRMVTMAVEVAIKHNLPTYLVLDAFFPSAAIFNLVNSVLSLATRTPFVSLVIKAKKNCTAHYRPSKLKKRVGRKPNTVNALN